MISDGIHTNPAALRIAHRAHPRGEPCQAHAVSPAIPSAVPSPAQSAVTCCPSCLKEVTATCADPPALLLWSDVAKTHLGPLWEGPVWCSAQSCSSSSCKANAALSLRSSGLVLVTDAIAGMGLAPGRHTLGQQVVEIDGLNTYIAGKCLLLKSWRSTATHAHSGELSTPCCASRLCHPLWFWCLIG